MSVSASTAILYPRDIRVNSDAHKFMNPVILFVQKSLQDFTQEIVRYCDSEILFCIG